MEHKYECAPLCIFPQNNTNKWNNLGFFGTDDAGIKLINANNAKCHLEYNFTEHQWLKFE